MKLPRAVSGERLTVVLGQLGYREFDKGAVTFASDTTALQPIQLPFHFTMH
jgi:hypothetical protein